jgi:hypothetical protein
MVSLAALPEETVAHIQSAGCKAQKKIVIGAHECLLRPAHFRPPSAYCDRRTFALAPASTFLVLDPAAATCIY